MESPTVSAPRAQTSASALHSTDTLASTTPTRGAISAAAAAASKRMQRYFAWCDHYRVAPVTDVTVVFRYSSTQHLAVGSSFTAQDLLPLAELLKYDNRITTLDFHRARVGNAGCYALADALPWNSTLREIDLAYNDIGEHGAIALARALERNTSVQRLNLRGNRIGPSGAVAFARLLRRTQSIAHLDLSNNYLRVRGVHELSRALIDRAHARLAKRASLRLRSVGFTNASGVAPGGATSTSADGSASDHGPRFTPRQHTADATVAAARSLTAVDDARSAESRARIEAEADVPGATPAHSDIDALPPNNAVGSGALRRRRRPDGSTITAAAIITGDEAVIVSNGSNSTAATASPAALLASEQLHGGDAPAVGHGVGWLWGDVHDLVVTQDAVVRADWGSLWLGNSDGDGSGGVATPPLNGTSSAGSTTSSTSGIRRSQPLHLSLRSTHGDDVTATSAEVPAHTTPSTTADEVSAWNHRDRAASGVSDASAHGGFGAAGIVHHTRQSPRSDADNLDIFVRISGNFHGEEVQFAVVHAIGLFLSVIGAVPLLSAARAARDSAQLLGISLYVGGLIAFYASATLNHSLFLTDASRVFRLMDHAAVFALISGTYSPFLLVNLRHTVLAAVLLCAVWVLAAVGIALNLVATPSRAQRRLRVILYLGMGWAGGLPFLLMHACLPGTAWALLAGGGALFSVGSWLYSGAGAATVHSLQVWWYLLVLCASALHYAAVFNFVAPPTADCVTAAAARGLAQWT